jgi:HK97 gp10 family phage protein
MYMRWRGDRDFNSRLTSLPDKIHLKIAKKAVRKGASFLRKQLQMALPVGPPPYHLKDSIGIRAIRDIARNSKTGRFRSKGTTGFAVGYVGKSRYYAHIKEFGSSRQGAGHEWEKTLAANAQEILDIMAAELRRGLDSL